MTPTRFEAEDDDPQRREIAESATIGQLPDARSSAIVDAVGQSVGNHDPVEAALADALTRAARAGQWNIVEVLSRELTARREARAGVVDLDSARKRRGTP